MEPNIPTNRYLSIQSLCKYLDVPHSTVKRWVRLNIIPSIKLEGRRLVDRNIIDSMLAELSSQRKAG